jgi:hypothetical protein
VCHEKDISRQFWTHLSSDRNEKSLVKGYKFVDGFFSPNLKLRQSFEDMEAQDTELGLHCVQAEAEEFGS